MANRKSSILPILISLFVGACGGAAASGSSLWVPKVLQLWQDAYNGPAEVIVRNVSSEPYAMSEVRAGNDVGCHADLGTTGSNYSDPEDPSIPANTGFIVTESTCNGMLIKSNGGPIELAAFDHGNVVIREHSGCPNVLNKGLCVDVNGSLWFVGKSGNITALAN